MSTPLNPAFTIWARMYFDTLPLAVVHMQRHGNNQPHTHDFSELVIVLQGSAVHVSPAGDRSIGAGDVFVLHPGQVHGYKDTASLNLVNVLFRMEELGVGLRDVESLPGYQALFAPDPEALGFESRLRLSAEQLARVKDRVREMALELTTRPQGWQFASVAQFMAIVSDLCRAYSERENPAARSLTRLSGVLAHIHQHYADEISLDDLAEIGHMSRRTLTREFRSALGVSPIDYLIRERVNRAMDLLRYSDVSVTEAAHRVGFQDSNYFTRQFHAVVGRSPREARRLSVL